MCVPRKSCIGCLLLSIFEFRTSQYGVLTAGGSLHHLCMCVPVNTNSLLPSPPSSVPVYYNVHGRPAAEAASAVECARECSTRHEFDCALNRHNGRLDVGS